MARSPCPQKGPTMAYTAQLTDAARDFHERMFPGYVSDLLRTDPEFIERFDNFAFDEVVSTGDLSDRTRLPLPQGKERAFRGPWHRASACGSGDHDA